MVVVYDKIAWAYNDHNSSLWHPLDGGFMNCCLSDVVHRDFDQPEENTHIGSSEENARWMYPR